MVIYIVVVYIYRLDLHIGKYYD